MPKGKKKGRDNRRERDRELSSEEDSAPDNLSESGQSDSRSLNDDGECEEGDGRLEERVCELVEQLGAKAGPVRTAALLALRSTLCRRYMCEVLGGSCVTLAEGVSRALRRGKPPERRAAAALAPLLALQVGEEGGEEFLRETRGALLAALSDDTDPELRAECCGSLAVMTLLLEQDVSRVLELAAVMETVFSAGYPKGDGSVRASECGSVSAGLEAWCVLVSALPGPLARAALLDPGARPGFARLVSLLASPAHETRVCAGAALGLGVEHACGGAVPEAVSAALPVLRDLACDSNKFRAKRHRKTQRATFRDLLKYIEEGCVPRESVRVGGEEVCVSSWRARCVYGALASALGAGLQACAPGSPALRAALGLPPDPPPPPDTKLLRRDKLQRQLQNAANCKARTVSRNKNRDKRSALLSL